MVNFEQTHPLVIADFSADFQAETSMTIPKDDKLKDHTPQAEHCVNIPTTTNKAADIQSEIAAEWLKLADAILMKPLKRKE